MIVPFWETSDAGAATLSLKVFDDFVFCMIVPFRTIFHRQASANYLIRRVIIPSRLPTGTTRGVMERKTPSERHRDHGKPWEFVQWDVIGG